MPSSSSFRSRSRPRLALVLAGVSAFLAMWIVVPAPNRPLLPLAVGAPEISAWLLVVGVVGLVLALVDVRRRVLSRVAVVLALVGVGLAASPFARFARVADAAERSMHMALGGDYLTKIPVTTRARFLSAPLSLSVLFRGIPAPTSPVTITRGVKMLRSDSVRDSVQLTMDVYQPDMPGVHPVLVQVYGGAWARGEPADFAEFAQYIAAQGYVVFAIDYRHAPQFVFPAQIDDVRYALRALSANAPRWHADMTRLALIGRSAGAHLAMLAAYATDAQPVRGVIDYYGPVDLVEGYRHPPVPDPLRVQQVEEAFLGGTPDAMLDRYHSASPITLVTRKLPPTLLIYGGRDHIVEPRFGELLAGRLQAEGGTVIHVQIPWAEHAFDNVPNGPSGQLARYVTERFLAAVMR